MRPSRQHLVTTASFALALGLAAVPAAHAAGRGSSGHHGGASSAAGARNAFRVRDLVSDGAVPAAHVDKSLVNPWGIASARNGPMRVADNGTGVSTAFDGSGARRSVVFKVPDGDPTGIVHNTSRRLDVGEGARAAPARFVLASETGVISAWSPEIDPHRAVVEFRAKDGAVYKGVAIDRVDGKPYVYATDFHNARIDVLDSSFRPVSLPGGFVDPHIPKGFAPFGIENVGGKLVVTFAKQDAARHDDVHGKGLGFVDVFDAQGRLLDRLASRGPLNAPWGLALAPEGFGALGGDLLVGNFGDGTIHAYDPASGKLEGTLRMANGKPVDIDGLWGLDFGNGAPGQPARALFFAAGPNGEADGLFGTIRAAPGR